MFRYLSKYLQIHICTLKYLDSLESISTRLFTNRATLTEDGAGRGGQRRTSLRVTGPDAMAAGATHARGGPIPAAGSPSAVLDRRRGRSRRAEP